MTGVGGEQTIPMAPEDVFDVVSNSRRRQIVRSVARADGSVSAGDLAVEIAAKEHTVDPSAVDSSMRSAVYTTLIQIHLETLDRSGAVNYDDRLKRVEATGATEPLAKYIEQITAACEGGMRQV